MMETVVLVAVGFLLGGIIKGATGVGAPLIAVPLLTMFYDVQTAVILFAVPNCLPNIWQCWRYRKHRLATSFISKLAIAGGLGTLIGTVLLIQLPATLLKLVLALTVYGYVIFRCFKPGWCLQMPLAQKLVIPTAAIAGTLQGASGISAPVSVSFVSALKLERPQFISTISIYFLATSVVQLPALLAFGLMQPDYLLLSTAAVLPLIAGMPIGSLLARKLSREHFDKVILFVLFVVATRLLIDLF